MRFVSLIMASGLGTLLPLPGRAGNAAVLRSEFVFERAPFRQCHASTIAETAPGRLAVAWFGGTREGNPDVGIWLARWEDDHWTEGVEVATGVQPDGIAGAGVESGAVPVEAGPVAAFLQGRPGARDVAGHAHDFIRRRALVVGSAPPAGRPPACGTDPR